MSGVAVAVYSGLPSSAGVPQAFAELTLVADYNDPGGLEGLFAQWGERIAAVIFEGVVGNAGVLVPTPEFLTSLRTLTRQHGALLIADEVMTGFRLAPGGAVERLGLEPDLVCWGKIIGGGLPVGAYGGKALYMSQVAPEVVSSPVRNSGHFCYCGGMSSSATRLKHALKAVREYSEAEGISLEEAASRVLKLAAAEAPKTKARAKPKSQAKTDPADAALERLLARKPPDLTDAQIHRMAVESVKRHRERKR